MGFTTILLWDFHKLLKRKITYLPLLTLWIPLVFGIGMAAKLSFIVSDGDNNFDVIGNGGISALQFTANMLSQSVYIIYLTMIIITSMSIANEIETGRVRLYLVKVCSRSKLLVSKIFTLFIFVILFMGIYALFSVGVYYVLVVNSTYGNGTFLQGASKEFYYLFITMIGIMVMIAITAFWGILMKSFQCFAASYLIWFIAKYLSFFDHLKMLVPDNYADVVLSEGVNKNKFFMWISIYCIYILCAALGAIGIFQRKDIK